MLAGGNTLNNVKPWIGGEVVGWVSGRGAMVWGWLLWPAEQGPKWVVYQTACAAATPDLTGPSTAVSARAVGADRAALVISTYAAC